jgi:hypothetical protein
MWMIGGVWGVWSFGDVGWAYAVEGDTRQWSRGRVGGWIGGMVGGQRGFVNVSSM